MLTPALVLLSQRDTDAPVLPGIATVSTDGAWDDGGYALGVAAAARGALWVDRPYFTGNPTVDWMVGKVDRVTRAGGYCQIGNEQNLPLEGWVGGDSAWRTFEHAVRLRVERLDRLLAMPPSPGVPGWTYWASLIGSSAIHAYGTFDRMQGIVRWYLDNIVGDVFVTECNPGAGNSFDLDAWAASDLRPFLDWCATEPRVRMVAYFAWRWRGAPPMPSSVDAAGTRVVDVLRTWTPPEIVPPADPPPPEVKPMHKRAYLWQFDQLGETSVAEIAATLRLGGVTEVACKTHQELTWLGNATDGDSSPLAFRSLGDVGRRHAAFRAEGITMVPWCVPTGTQVDAEAKRAAEVALVCDGVIELDVEPYAGFWQGPYEGLEPYCRGIVDRGAGYELNMDARPGGVDPFGTALLGRVASAARRFWTQSYWTTFGRAADAVVREALAVLDGIGVPVGARGIIFPWDGPDAYAAAVQQVARAEVGAVGMWRMGPAGPAVYAALAAIPSASAEPEPTPEPAVDPTDDALNGLWSLTERLAAIEHAPLAEEMQRKIVDLKVAIGR